MKNTYGLHVIITVIALLVLQTAAAMPIITSVSPGTATPGKLVKINGTGFNVTPALNKVYFGSVSVPVTSASATSLTVTVPPQATYSPISVTTGGLTAYSPLPFVVSFNAFDTLTAGSFGNHQQPLMPSGPQASAIFDIDGDGKPDVVTITWSGNRLCILPNTSSPGSITFGARIDSVTGNTPSEIAIADIDGDGKLDIVYTDFGDTTFSVFRNTSTPGTFSFAPRVSFRSGNSPTGVAVGDLDGDGKPDVVVANETGGTVAIFRNTSTAGTITFSAPIVISNLPNPGLPHSVAIGDLDGDGQVDIAVTNIDQREVSIYQNTSTPGAISVSKVAALQLMPDSLHAPLFVAMGDIDRDGKLDLVVSDTANSVFVLRNISSGNGSFAFASLVRYFKGNGVGAVTITDFDGDGRPDIIAGNATDNTVSVFKNLSPLGSVSFAPKVDFAMGAYPIRIAAGDIDGDGHPDFVGPDYQGESIDVYRNQSSNGWVNVNFAAFLQGAYVGGVDSMLLTLRGTAGFKSHFASVPVPARAVDSITIELRDKATSPTYRHFAPAWLMSDGFIRSFNDTTLAYAQVDSVVSGSTNFIVVRHRNHLAIMSATGHILTSDPAPGWYDFTSSQSSCYGTNPLVFVSPSYLMPAGDANGSGIVTAADANAVFAKLNAAGYYSEDVNLSGIVTAADANMLFANLNLASFVP